MTDHPEKFALQESGSVTEGVSPEADQRQPQSAGSRPLLQAIARMIATDRRAVLLATAQGEVLLANAPANRLGLVESPLQDRLPWVELCFRARRAGSVPATVTLDGAELEGEVVQLPLGATESYLLRLSENDHEAAWLRNRTRTATLMRVAHDLRTPIQSLIATAEGLLTREAGADPTKDRARMARAAEVALDHISNVLAVIRGEQDVTGLIPDEDFSLTEELRGILALVEPIAQSRGAEVTLHLDPPQELWVHGPVRFARALIQNMIDNSIKYGGKAVDIHLSHAPAPEDPNSMRITLEVRDQGGGLPPEQRARLRRALGGDTTAAAAPAEDDRSAVPSAGLNVLAHALRQLGGRLEVLDRGVDGAPLNDATAPVTGTILRATFALPGASPALAEALPAGDTDELAGLSLLIVEDSPSSRDWLVHVLTRAGAEVSTAGNGREALALIRRLEEDGRLDLVLTDMTLPHMTGVELAARIHSEAQTRPGAWQGPVLGLTAHVGPEIRAACKAAGVIRVLEKPIRPAALRDAILSALPDRSTAVEASATNQPIRSTESLGDSDLISIATVSDLIEQLGADGTRGFMRRALAEARAVADRLRADGPAPDTGRQLHAATGACGLTGLTAVERCLRALEVAVEASDTTLDPLRQKLDDALDRTGEAIDRVGS